MAKEDRRNEICIKTSSSLGAQLCLLLNFMFNLHQIPKEQLNALIGNLQRAMDTLLAKKKVTDANAVPVTAAFKNLLNDTIKKSNYSTNDPNKLFQYLSHDQALHCITLTSGTNRKQESPLYNQDLIIGLHAARGNFSISYYLDFDYEKKLHLNIHLKIKNTDYSLAQTQLEPSPRNRFFVSNVPCDYYGKTLKNAEDVQLDKIKLKFSLKMTIAALIHNLHPVKNNNFFCNSIKELGYGENYHDLLTKKEIRDNLIADLIEKYTNKRKTNIHVYTEAPNNMFDSELQSDSWDYCKI